MPPPVCQHSFLNFLLFYFPAFALYARPFAALPGAGFPPAQSARFLICKNFTFCLLLFRICTLK
jgi:hypothetical protein